jgi:hypothetical protein
MPRLVVRSHPADQIAISFAEVLAAIAASERATDGAERHYALSEEIYLVVGVTWRPSLTMTSREPVAAVWPCRTNGDTHVDLGALTPADIVKAAEFKAVVDEWVSGKRPHLPPSTFTRPPDDDDIAWPGKPPDTAE